MVLRFSFALAAAAALASPASAGDPRNAASKALGNHYNFYVPSWYRCYPNEYYYGELAATPGKTPTLAGENKTGTQSAVVSQDQQQIPPAEMGRSNEGKQLPSVARQGKIESERRSFSIQPSIESTIGPSIESTTEPTPEATTIPEYHYIFRRGLFRVRPH